MQQQALSLSMKTTLTGSFDRVIWGWYDFDKLKKWWYNLVWVMKMGRQARRFSETGLYHIVFRGVNHCHLFEEAIDYEKF